MFSVVWPFCAIAAFLNNIVHIRNSFHKLLVHRRRPVPRKTNSIGQWEKMLLITLILGIFIMVGLICLSSGELEYFVKECLVLERFNGKNFNMNPEFSCLNTSSRFLVALVLEHGAILIVFILMDNISDTPASVRTSFQRKKELIRRAICGHGKTSTATVASSIDISVSTGSLPRHKERSKNLDTCTISGTTPDSNSRNRLRMMTTHSHSTTTSIEHL
jgi:hypothetical protein